MPESREERIAPQFVAPGQEDKPPHFWSSYCDAFGCARVEAPEPLGEQE